MNYVAEACSLGQAYAATDPPDVGGPDGYEEETLDLAAQLQHRAQGRRLRATVRSTLPAARALEVLGHSHSTWARVQGLLQIG